MTKKDYEKRIEELKKRAELIPAITDDKMKEMNEFAKVYNEREAERVKAQKTLNEAKMERNKALRNKQKISREVRELNNELDYYIPRKISYCESKIRQLEKNKLKDSKQEEHKDELDKVIETLQKKRFTK